MQKNRLGSAGKIKIFLVEYHPIFRNGLVQVINNSDSLQVCGEAEDFPGASVL
jgi:DNA-binding NarL/FixJ family response regulator